MSEFANNLEEDPAAEFLAREQADLAGIVDEDVTAAINTEQLQQSNGSSIRIHIRYCPIGGSNDEFGSPASFDPSRAA